MALREFRAKKFPRELFDEHAWTMLLLLFVGLVNNEVVTEQSLIEQTNVTPSAGRRWIAHLVNDGQLTLRNEGDVVLTHSATEALRAFLDHAAMCRST